MDGQTDTHTQPQMQLIKLSLYTHALATVRLGNMPTYIPNTNVTKSYTAD